MSDQAKVRFLREDIKIPSATPNCDLDAWLYLPAAFEGPCPVVVMGHCISMSKHDGLPPYAEAFAAEGYAVVAFDYRRWGESDGSPRYCMSIKEYQEDYRTVVGYCRSQPALDPERVILWGTAFSGGHVVKLASENELGIAAVIAQCPFLGDGFRPVFGFSMFWVLGYALVDLFRQAIGLAPLYIPAAGKAGELAAVITPGVKEKVFELRGTDYKAENLISPWSTLQISSYKPARNAAKIACPVLIIAAERDNLVSFKSAVEINELLPKGELVGVDAEYFDFYPRQRYHEKSLASQLDFLRRHVPACD